MRYGVMSEEPPLLSPALISVLQQNDLTRLHLLKESGEPLTGQNSSGDPPKHGYNLKKVPEKAAKASLKSFRFSTEDVELLLDEDTTNLMDARGRTPLVAALQESDCEDLALELIEGGCDINLRDKQGNTALHHAISSRCWAVCEALIENGVDLDARNNLGKTALFLASEHHLVDEVFMLLFYGADPTIPAKWGCNCIDLLAIHRNEKIQKFFYNNLYNHYNSLNLSILTYAMEFNLPAFPVLIENTEDIRYTFEDLEDFSDKITVFKPKYFKLFLDKFDYIVEEVVEELHLSLFFDCAEDPFRHIVSYTENLYTILTSKIAPQIVEKIHEKRFPAISYVINSYRYHKERLDEITKLICALLALGVSPNKIELARIYLTYNQCELFRIMLHMDVEEDNGGNCHRKHLMLELISSVGMTIEKFLGEADSFNEITLSYAFDYFACPKLKKFCLGLGSDRLAKRIETLPNVPLLVELARDSARGYIIKKYNPTNARQFYTVINELPIATIHKEIIAFRRKLYPCSRINLF